MEKGDPVNEVEYAIKMIQNRVVLYKGYNSIQMRNVVQRIKKIKEWDKKRKDNISMQDKKVKDKQIKEKNRQRLIKAYQGNYGMRKGVSENEFEESDSYYQGNKRNRNRSQKRQKPTLKKLFIVEKVIKTSEQLALVGILDFD